jgi:hypothetical protein
VLHVSFSVANLLGILSTPQGLFVPPLSIAEKMVTPKTLHYTRLREAFAPLLPRGSNVNWPLLVQLCV